MNKKINIRTAHIWFALVFSLIASMSILKYLTLHSAIMDLGIFVYNLYKISELQIYGNILYVHTHLYLLPLAWITGLFPNDASPLVLLLLQSFFLAIPIYFIYERFGRIVALGYFLFFPFWFNALFDFHFEHLAIVLLLAFFLCAQSGKIGCAVISAIALAFVKEVFALQTLMCGIYILFALKPGKSKPNEQQRG